MYKRQGYARTKTENGIRKELLVCAYARPTRRPVLTYAMLLLGDYEASGQKVVQLRGTSIYKAGLLLLVLAKPAISLRAWYAMPGTDIGV